jgi:hypothetical protein
MRITFLPYLTGLLTLTALPLTLAQTLNSEAEQEAILGTVYVSRESL